MKSITLSNNTVRVTINQLGSTITRLQYHTKKGWTDTVVSYTDDASIKDDQNYLNAVCGPHAGRIKDGIYRIKGSIKKMPTNDRGNNLHSFPIGYDKKEFDIITHTNTSVSLRYENNDVTIISTYTISNCELEIQLKGRCKKEMLLNMTQHTYFNLDLEETIENQSLNISSDAVSLLDETGCPTPHHIAIKDTVFDFNTSQRIGDALNRSHPQFTVSKHIDHPYRIKKWPIILSASKQDYAVEIEADCDFAVVYFGQSFEANEAFRGKVTGKPYSGIAIEPQDLPNGINMNASQVYDGDHPFERTIVYRFTNT